MRGSLCGHTATANAKCAPFAFKSCNVTPRRQVVTAAPVATRTSTKLSVPPRTRIVWHEQTGRTARSSVGCSSGIIRGVLSKCHPAFHALHNLEPQFAFIADGIAEQLLPVIVGGWLLVTVISIAAKAARKWCDAHPDAPMALEAMGLLPAALESPTRFAVICLVATRLVRNSAGLLHQFVEKFSPKWDSFVDGLVAWIISALGPLDQALVSLYTVLAVAVTTRVLIKWKTFAIEWIIKQQRMKESKLQHQQWQHAGKAAYSDAYGYYEDEGADVSRSSGSGSYDQSSSSAALQQEHASRTAVPHISGSGVVTMQGAGRMVAVEMRPRSTAEAVPRRATAASRASHADSEAAAAAGIDADREELWHETEESPISSIDADDMMQAAYKRKVNATLFAGKCAEDLERLLLPLDGILSWVFVVVSMLFTIQALGINIQPLLAVGGASSIIIGLATQTLLTNAVTGMSFFLARPFVAGDSVTIQGIGNMIFSGTVERITPMRTLLRTEEDVLVTIPNRSVSEMVIFNSSRRDARKQFKIRNTRERQYVKFKVKQPHQELGNVEQLQDVLKQVLRRPGVSQQNINIGLSKFTDAGAELVVEFLLLVAPSSSDGQRLLIDLALAVRQNGATLVSIM